MTARIRRKPTPVALFDEKSMTLKLNKRKLNRKFKDGTKVASYAITKVGKHIYFDRSGRDRNGNCQMWRARVKFTPEGHLVIDDSVPRSGCKGEPCSSCKWTGGGTGCACRKTGTCNHWLESGIHGPTSGGVFIA